MLKCSKCGVEKELSEFNNDKRSSTGKYSACKECHLAFGKRYRVTFRAFVGRCYGSMAWRVNNKQSYKGRRVLITREQFLEWALTNAKFRTLHDNYVASGRNRKLTPTIDRISGGDYALDNIQVLTHSENTRKYRTTGL